jgi:hypothetical protein
LKRVIDFKGRLTTRTFDIWEKVLFGPEDSGLINNRSTYVLRRFNDLAITCNMDTFRLFFYYQFLLKTDALGADKVKVIFNMLFYITNGFTDKAVVLWRKFTELSLFDVKKSVRDA